MASAAPIAPWDSSCPEASYVAVCTQSLKIYNTECTAFNLQQNREEMINSHLRTLGAKQPFPNLDWKLYPRRNVPSVSSFLLLKGQQPAGGDCWQRMELTPYHFNTLHTVLPITFYNCAL